MTKSTKAEFRKALAEKYEAKRKAEALRVATRLGGREDSESLKLEIESAQYHRNGDAGEGFFSVIFRFTEDGTERRMVATVLNARAEREIGAVPCFVLEIERLGVTAWRGDTLYRPLLYKLAEAGHLHPEFLEPEDDTPAEIPAEVAVPGSSLARSGVSVTLTLTEANTAARALAAAGSCEDSASPLYEVLRSSSDKIRAAYDDALALEGAAALPTPEEVCAKMNPTSWAFTAPAERRAMLERARQYLDTIRALSS